MIEFARAEADPDVIFNDIRCASVSPDYARTSPELKTTREVAQLESGQV